MGVHECVDKIQKYVHYYTNYPVKKQGLFPA